MNNLRLPTFTTFLSRTEVFTYSEQMTESDNDQNDHDHLDPGKIFKSRLQKHGKTMKNLQKMEKISR